MNSRTIAVALVMSSFFLAASIPAEARGGAVRGSRGALGGFSRSGNWGRAAGAGAITQNGGFGATGFQGTTANGTTVAGGAGGAFKRGVGGFGASRFSATGANGGKYAGYKQGAYNAQTGQGMYDSGKNYTNPSGQQYGYDQSTSFTKGSGGTTTLDTQNKGDYTVDWAKGTKPVVTPVPAE